MPRQRAPARFSRTRRPPSSWARHVDTGVTLVAAGTKVLLSTIVLSNPGIGETIRRTRGTIQILSDQSAAREAMSGALGFVVVSDLAIAAGAASIPGPVTDGSDDGWYSWTPFVLADAIGLALSTVPLDFDSKAMRRIEEGFGVAIMLENASATTGFNAHFGFSTLTTLS